MLLYDLTSTYFEADPPFPEGDKRRFGYSRDHRPDCVQIVIALVVTPEGLPLAYEVLPGNTADRTTLRPFLEQIERQYGKARRVWLMDRGVPTEEVLAEMRAADPPVHYLVGTPKSIASIAISCGRHQPRPADRRRAAGGDQRLALCGGFATGRDRHFPAALCYRPAAQPGAAVRRRGAS